LISEKGSITATAIPTSVLHDLCESMLHLAHKQILTGKTFGLGFMFTTLQLLHKRKKLYNQYLRLGIRAIVNVRHFIIGNVKHLI
jgi:hypothetical protein